MFEQLLLPPRPAPGVVAHKASGDLIPGKEPPRQTRVLGRDERHRLEDLDGAERYVAEIAYGRGDDEEPAGSPRPGRGIGQCPAGHRQGRRAACHRAAHRRAEPGRRRG